MDSMCELATWPYAALVLRVTLGLLFIVHNHHIAEFHHFIIRHKTYPPHFFVSFVLLGGKGPLMR